MQSYRLRLTLRDLPGALAEVTSSLAEAGCNVLRVDVQAIDGRTAVDELSVQVPPGTTAGEIRDRIVAAGALPVLVDPLPAETDRDPVTAALDDLAEVAGVEPDARTRRLEAALERQLGADGAWVLPRPAPSIPLLGRETVDSPTVLTTATAGGHARDRTATVALVPAGDALGVALRWGCWDFSASELARAGALLRTGALVSAVPDIGPGPEPASVGATRLGPVAIRPLVPSDAVHLLDLDLHLSDRSRRLRFNGARGLPSGEELRTVASTQTDRRAYGAWTAGGLVGEARFVALPDDPGTAELAIAIADHAQRSGVGTVLLGRLLADARDRGLRRAIAATAPANDGIRRLLAAVSPVTITRIAHGEVEHQLDLASLPPASVR